MQIYWGDDLQTGGSQQQRWRGGPGGVPGLRARGELRRDRAGPLPRSRDGDWCYPWCWNMLQCRITSILTKERQDVCEGTIIIEICCLCLCSCFYFDSKVLNSPVPPLYFVTWLRWSYRSVHQFINYKNFWLFYITRLHEDVREDDLLWGQRTLWLTTTGLTYWQVPGIRWRRSECVLCWELNKMLENCWI